MSVLWEVALRVSGVLALGFLLKFLAQRKSAALRHLIWLSAFAAALAAPALVAFGSKLGLALLKPATMEAHAGHMDIVTVSSIPGQSEPAPGSLPYSGIVWGLWSAGALACAMRMLRSVAKARALRASGEPVETFEGVPVAESESAPVAMTLGIRAPLILLPMEHRGWSPQRKHCVLVHELAHVRRRDCLLQWLPHTVCALHWFNPIAWLARSQMLCEAERACDDAVVSAGAKGSDFARDLLDIAASSHLTSSMKGPDPMMITVASKLERRIARLLDTSANRRPLTRIQAVAAIAAAFLVFVPLAGVRAQDAAPGAAATTAVISGIVTDPSAARVPGATVTLTGPSIALTLTSSGDGNWTAPGLAPGPYQFAVSKPGFATLHRSVNVAAGESRQLQQALSLGQSIEEVTVTARGTPRAAPETAPGSSAGGSVQAARAIYAPKPVYPDSLRAQGLEGSVTIAAIIGKSGEVVSPRVVGEQQPSELAEMALAAVRTWRYRPTLLNGAPVETLTTITVNFKLQ